jgi:hypothetical protein
VPLAKNAKNSERIADALVELNQVRFGPHDEGPAFLTPADGDPLQFPFNEYPVAVLGTASTSARYNPWVLSYRVEQNTVVVTNYTDELISGAFHLRSAEQSLIISADIPARGRHTITALEKITTRPFVGISDPQINHQPLPPPDLIAPFAALPAHALPVTVDDPRLNPLTLLTTTERLENQQVRVTFYNIGGLPISAQWKILGFMNETQSLPELKPGQAHSITVALEKSDLRVILARIAVSHIQLGPYLFAQPK